MVGGLGVWVGEMLCICGEEGGCNWDERKTGCSYLDSVAVYRLSELCLIMC